MQKNILVITSLAIGLVIMASVFVYAAGTSTGSSNTQSEWPSDNKSFYQKESTDTCKNSTVLIESYIGPTDGLETEEHFCPYGCSDGVCNIGNCKVADDLKKAVEENKRNANPRPDITSCYEQTTQEACLAIDIRSNSNASYGVDRMSDCKWIGVRIVSNLTASCETRTEVKDRIKCRLEERGIENLNVTEESCRTLADPGKCRQLYKISNYCYELEGRQKDQCFKRAAGFVKETISHEAATKNNESIRNYLVLLLYDLQERIEHAYEDGTITDREGVADAIALIVEIKQDIMSGKRKAEIKPKVADLRTKLTALKLQ